MVIFFKMLRNFTNLKIHNKLGFLIPTCTTNTVHRKLNLSIRLNVKMFMEYENKYAYEVMTNKGYRVALDLSKKSTSLTKEQFDHIISSNLTELSAQEIYQIFPKLGIYCSENNLCISNNIFDNYIDALTDNIKYATDFELTSLFHSLKMWPDTPNIRTRNFIEVWAALDDECKKRILKWSFDEILSYLALFFMINVSRYSDFYHKSLQRLATKAKQLTPPQIVQAMFFISIYRKSPFDMHNLEICIENCFTEFNIDELAILSMGFFKSKTPIRSMELVSRIIEKVIDTSKDIHEVSLAALLKVIRYSRKINTDDKVYDMLEALQHEAPRLSIMCNVHMALVGTATLTFHKGCLTKIADVLNKNLSQSRVKDFERMVLSYGTFNFIPKLNQCLFSNIIEELRRKERDEEIKRYGRSFLCCIGFLGLLQFYPVDLINKALDPEFLKSIYGKYTYAYGREVLVINNIAQIFCKESKLNLLSDKDITIIAKKYTDYIPDENYSKQYNVTERMFMDVKSVIAECRGGAKYVTGYHILSHHQRGDIILCNDQDDRPLPVEEMFVDKKFGLIYPPPDNNKWIVLVIAGRNSMIYKSDVATGHYQSKIRELNAIGYQAALVLWSIYSRCKSREEKLDYLQNLIDNVSRQ